MHTSRVTTQPRHLLVKLEGAAPDPYKRGDTASWFYYYKWDITGEVFFQIKEEPVDVVAGDLLWFALDGVLLGCVPLLRVEHDLINGAQELWYLGEAIRPLNKKIRVKGPAGRRFVSQTQAARWLACCKEAQGHLTKKMSQADAPFSFPQAQPAQSLIIRAPSDSEMNLLTILRTQPDRLCLMPVVCDGVNRLALALLTNQNEEQLPVPVALLVEHSTRLLTLEGDLLVSPDPPEEPARNKSLN